MKHKNGIYAAIALFLILALNILTVAQVRIRFAPGKSSATVTGRMAAGGRVCYFAAANRGQALTASLTSNSGRVHIFESGSTTYSYDVETSGDQSVCVDNIGKASTYTLTVSIK
jgi:hypothetical protein